MTLPHPNPACYPLLPATARYGRPIPAHATALPSSACCGSSATVALP
ncbi:hypothetical protein [Cupriavidus sp. PET2-C1]